MPTMYKHEKLYYVQRLSVVSTRYHRTSCHVPRAEFVVVQHVGSGFPMGKDEAHWVRNKNVRAGSGSNVR